MRAIDLFAGAGGFSTGATQAGANVVWAANHWQVAVDTHAANHASTQHACQDLHQADWSRVPDHDLLLASPACQGHSKARGRQTFGERFVMPYYGSGSGLTGRSLDRPLGTVTTRDRWAVVDGDRMRMLAPDEYRDTMGFPRDYVLPVSSRKTAIHLLGNAVCPPVARDLVSALMAAA